MSDVQATVARLRAAHKPGVLNARQCSCCWGEYPCDTIQALDALDAAAAKEAELRAVLSQWKCPSCGGTGTYTQRGASTGYTAVLVPCSVCKQGGLHPIAAAALATPPSDATERVQRDAAAATDCEHVWATEARRDDHDAIRGPLWIPRNGGDIERHPEVTNDDIFCRKCGAPHPKYVRAALDGGKEGA